MNTLRGQYSFIAQFLGGQPVEPEKTYRQLSFCRTVDVDGETVVFDVLTGEIAALTAAEAAILRAPAVLPGAETEALIRGWFLVPEGHDDIGLSEEVRTLALDLRGQLPLTEYVIFPTTDCNARCFYCYERGVARMPMSAGTAHAVADFILRSHGGKPVTLFWFGGEPLYNAEVIDIVSAALRDAGVSYRARMISNGYLFDRATVAKAVSLWKLYRVQITLDGTEEIYNRTKAYIYKGGKSPFRVVTDNIEALLEAKITVGIRMNMGPHNRTDLYRLVEWIDARYPDRQYLRVYPHLLFDSESDPPEARTLAAKQRRTEEMIALEDFCAARGLLPIPQLRPKMSVNYCMMDSPRSVTVLPDGSLGKCEHHVADQPVGDLAHGITDPARVASFAVRGTCKAVCDGCALYPTCNRLAGCPALGRSFCDAADRFYALTRLDRSIRAAGRRLLQADAAPAADADAQSDC